MLLICRNDAVGMQGCMQCHLLKLTCHSTQEWNAHAQLMVWNMFICKGNHPRLPQRFLSGVDWAAALQPAPRQSRADPRCLLTATSQLWISSSGAGTKPPQSLQHNLGRDVSSGQRNKHTRRYSHYASPSGSLAMSLRSSALALPPMWAGIEDAGWPVRSN